MKYDELMTRQEAEAALITKGQETKRYNVGEKWELNGEEIREAFDAMEPTGAFVRCEYCKHRGDPMKCLVAKFAKEKDVPYFFIDNHGKWFCADGEKEYS